jgi:glycosyltransferase involved in cell wall biosynthesis
MTILNSLESQTNPNWTAHVVIDGETDLYEDVKGWYQDIPKVKFSHIKGPNKDWGHSARQYGLSLATEYWCVMTGDDNYYMPTFVDEFLKEGKGKVTFVYCDMVHNSYNYQPIKSEVRLGGIDIGNFMSVTESAKDIILDTTDYNADYKWIVDYLKKQFQKKMTKIDKVLYVHN